MRMITCHACGAEHLATRCHICKEPVIGQEERRELFEAYASLQNPLRLPFDEFLRRRVLLGCLRNVVHARKRRVAAQRAADPASFELAP